MVDRLILMQTVFLARSIPGSVIANAEGTLLSATGPADPAPISTWGGTKGKERTCGSVAIATTSLLNSDCWVWKSGRAKNLLAGRNSRDRETRHLNGPLRIDVNFDLLWLELRFFITFRKERELLVCASSKRERARLAGSEPPEHGEIKMRPDASPNVLSCASRQFGSAPVITTRQFPL